jgi:hypothetical protein
MVYKQFLRQLDVIVILLKVIPEVIAIFTMSFFYDFIYHCPIYYALLRVEDQLKTSKK